MKERISQRRIRDLRRLRNLHCGINKYFSRTHGAVLYASSAQRYVFSLYSCLHLPTLRILTHISALAKLVYRPRMAIVTTRSRLALRTKNPPALSFKKTRAILFFFFSLARFPQFSSVSSLNRLSVEVVFIFYLSSTLIVIILLRKRKCAKRGESYAS